MEYTYYGFQNVIGAYFEMPTSDARGLLPSFLQPVELQHSRSVLAVTCFEFHESLVGAYNEVVLAIVVPPLVQPGRPLPKAGLYPFVVGTSTEAARLHAIERWHLPHYMKDLDISFSHEDGRMDVLVRDAGKPVLDLVVTAHEYHPTKALYNSFMADDQGRFKANIYMDAPHSEHEDERGSMELHEHPMTAGLTLPDVASAPFREEWFRRGVQTFEPLERL
jgi:hypothetical protein